MLMKKFYNKIYNLYPCLCTKDYKRDVIFLNKLFEKYNVTTVLDLGCGSGEHDRLLAAKGYYVDGLDISENMIKIAIKKSKNIKNITYTISDMRNFNLNKKYDAIICMLANFQYLISKKDVNSFLDSIFKHLKKKGILILDVYNKEVYKDYSPKTFVERRVGNDILHKLSERIFLKDDMVLIKRYYFLNYNLVSCGDFKVKFYNQNLLEKLIREKTDKKIKVFYDYSLRKKNGLTMQFLIY